jgi:hypothetical protein
MLRNWLEAERRGRAADAAGRATAEDRRLLHEACEEAHRRGTHVEQLIILIKQLWPTLPPRAAGDGRGALRGEDWRDGERQALERVVRVCIEEFYSPAWVDAGQPADRASTDDASSDSAARDELAPGLRRQVPDP